MGSAIDASETAVLGGYGICIGFCASAACSCSRCHRKEGCSGLFGRVCKQARSSYPGCLCGCAGCLSRATQLTLPVEPLNTFPLRVLLSRRPISQEVSDRKESVEVRLLIARGTVRQASLCSCSVSKVTGDSCAASDCQETAAMLMVCTTSQQDRLCFCLCLAQPGKCLHGCPKVEQLLPALIYGFDSCLIRWL